MAAAVRDQYRCFSSTSTRTSARAAAAARPLARRPRRPDRRRRRQPDDLLLRRRDARATCWTSRGGSPRPRWCGWSATTGRRRRSWSLANRLIASRPAADAATRVVLGAAAGRPGAGRCWCPPTSRPRPRPWCERSERWSTQGVDRARSRCCSGSTPSPRPTRRRSPRRACPTRCAAASGSSSAPRCARRWRCCAARPHADGTSTPERPGRPGARPCSSRWATARTRPPGRAGARPVGVAGRAGRARRGRAGRRTDPRPTSGRPGRRARSTGPTPSTPRRSGVTLASLHAAKGLEWDAVFLVGLADGTLPITHATTPEQVEEERRLLYVGITRARTHLAFSFARSRSAGDRRRGRLAVPGRARPGGSRPTTRAPPVAPHASARVGVVPWLRSRPDDCRRAKLRHCSHCEVDVDLVLFEQLREWRKQTADAASVPAFVVFTDATLTAIAARPADDPTALLQIPGIGQVKVDRYGDALLDVVIGRRPTRRNKSLAWCAPGLVPFPGRRRDVWPLIEWSRPARVRGGG